MFLLLTPALTRTKEHISHHIEHRVAVDVDANPNHPLG